MGKKIFTVITDAFMWITVYAIFFGLLYCLFFIG